MVLARKLRPLLYGTIGLCALSIVVSSVALASDNWYEREAAHTSIAIPNLLELEYGLFSGKKSTRINAVGVTTLSLSVVCSGSLCMFSCGLDAERREDDIMNLINDGGESDNDYCRERARMTAFQKVLSKASQSTRLRSISSGFFHLGYWISTIIFVAMSIIFALIGGALAVYNCLESPTQPIVGVFGLYIWNGCAAASTLLAMILWGACFDQQLKGNGAISETIDGRQTYVGNGILGWCYWILILPVIFHGVNLGILYYHSWRLSQSDKQITQVIDDKLTNGDNLLF